MLQQAFPEQQNKLIEKQTAACITYIKNNEIGYSSIDNKFLWAVYLLRSNGVDDNHIFDAILEGRKNIYEDFSSYGDCFGQAYVRLENVDRVKLENAFMHCMCYDCINTIGPYIKDDSLIIAIYTSYIAAHSKNGAYDFLKLHIDNFFIPLIQAYKRQKLDKAIDALANELLKHYDWALAKAVYKSINDTNSIKKIDEREKNNREILSLANDIAMQYWSAYVNVPNNHLLIKQNMKEKIRKDRILFLAAIETIQEDPNYYREKYGQGRLHDPLFGLDGIGIPDNYLANQNGLFAESMGKLGQAVKLQK